MSPPAAYDAAPVRDVVVGVHSAVWRVLAPQLTLLGHAPLAIGHHDLTVFEFTGSDRVWVFSFSRVPAENVELLAHLGRAGVQEIVYVSSSSTIVSARTTCYKYPRVKRLAEQAALAWPNARVLTIGLMHDRETELPGGATIATSYLDLANFIAAPHWADRTGERTTRLFRLVTRPLGHPVERAAHALYGALLRLSGPFPCVLRPLDLLLRALGVRWYGYVYLSNRLWMSTIS